MNKINPNGSSGMLGAPQRADDAIWSSPELPASLNTHAPMREGLLSGLQASSDFSPGIKRPGDLVEQGPSVRRRAQLPAGLPGQEAALASSGQSSVGGLRRLDGIKALWPRAQGEKNAPYARRVNLLSQSADVNF